MRIILTTLNLLIVFALNAQTLLKTNKKNFAVEINNKVDIWKISHKEEIHRCYVYCWQEQNEVEFITDIDSVTFSVKEGDTIRFNILLKGTDTAATEIVGIKGYPNMISQRAKIYYLSLLWSEAKNNFMNYDNLTFDLDSLYTELAQEVLDSKNDYEYYRILKKFIANLDDGHSQVYDGGAFYEYRDYAVVSLTNIERKIYLIGFRKTLEGKLALGSELIEINGVPTEEYMEKEVLPYISGSTEQWKWWVGKNKICQGLKGDSVKLKFKTPKGNIQTVKLPFDGESTRYDTKGNEKVERIGIEYKYTPNFDLSFTGDSIAILRINRFYPEKVVNSFTKLLPQLYKAKGLVIDMRANRGGSTSVAEFILKYIIKEDTFLSLASECRENDAVYKALGFGYDEYKLYYQGLKYRQIPSDTIPIPDSIEQFDYPITVLIGIATFSAAEDFLVTLYEHKDRPLFIGEPTGGSTGSPLVIEGFPYGGYAKICARRCKLPYSGNNFVSQGIIPDIEVYPTIDDILNNKDVVLEKGIYEIRKQLND